MSRVSAAVDPSERVIQKRPLNRTVNIFETKAIFKTAASRVFGLLDEKIFLGRVEPRSSEQDRAEQSFWKWVFFRLEIFCSVFVVRWLLRQPEPQPFVSCLGYVRALG